MCVLGGGVIDDVFVVKPGVGNQRSMDRNHLSYIPLKKYSIHRFQVVHF